MGSDTTVKLFSFGTLRQRDVQLATFGRELEGVEDILAGFSLSTVVITDPAVVALSGKSVHPLLQRNGDLSHEVAGTVFSITEAELAAADDYEVDAYKRIAVRLKSGTEAFVYVDAND